MSTISSQPGDLAGVSSRASQLSSTAPRIFPTRSVRHPSSKRPSAARSHSGSQLKAEVPPEPSTSSSPNEPPAASPSLVSQPLSLDDVLPEPTTYAEQESDRGDGHQDGASVSHGGTGSIKSLQYLTTRFEHSVGEDGTHLVLTGRDGELQRCEDEVRLCVPSLLSLAWLTFRRSASISVFVGHPCSRRHPILRLPHRLRPARPKPPHRTTSLGKLQIHHRPLPIDALPPALPHHHLRRGRSRSLPRRARYSRRA